MRGPQNRNLPKIQVGRESEIDDQTSESEAANSNPQPPPSGAEVEANKDDGRGEHHKKWQLPPLQRSGKLFNRTRVHQHQLVRQENNHGRGQNDENQMDDATLPYPDQDLRESHRYASPNHHRPGNRDPVHRQGIGKWMVRTGTSREVIPETVRAKPMLKSITKTASRDRCETSKPASAIGRCINP